MDADEFERVAVVCDDEQSFAVLVGSVVEHFGYTVHTCRSAVEAIELAAHHDPDLIVIDLDLGPGPTGIDVLLHIRDQTPWVAGVILTGHRSPKLVRRDLPASIEGVAYVVKSDLQSTKDLRDAIEAAVDRVPTALTASSDVPRLTAMQADLLRMINEGLSNEEIAKQRSRTLRSVQRMVARLYLTMGIEDAPDVNARVIAARMYRDGQVTTR